MTEIFPSGIWQGKFFVCRYGCGKFLSLNEAIANVMFIITVTEKYFFVNMTMTNFFLENPCTMTINSNKTGFSTVIISDLF